MTTAYGYLNTPDGVDVDYFRNWRGWVAAHPASPSAPA